MLRTSPPGRTRYLGLLAAGIGTLIAGPAHAQGRSLASIDVCALVPSSEIVAGLAAHDAGPPRDISRPGARACRYHYSIGSERHTPEIAIVKPADYEAARKRVPEGLMREFRGLGDVAFAAQTDEGLVLYALRRNDVAVRVTLKGRIDDADDLLHARALARRALEALR